MQDISKVTTAQNLASIISNQALIIGELSQQIEDKEEKIKFLEEKILKETGEKIE